MRYRRSVNPSQPDFESVNDRAVKRELSIALPVLLPVTALERVVQVLRRSGFAIDPDAPRVLALTHDYLQPELEVIAKGETRPWLLMRIADDCWTGPMFGPGEPVCWFCMAHWLRTARDPRTASKGRPELVVSLPEVVAGTLVRCAGALTAGDTMSKLGGAIHSYNAHDRSWSSFRVPAGPDCRCLEQQAGRSPLDWVSPIGGIMPSVFVTAHSVCGRYLAHAPFFQPRPRRRRTFLIEPGAAFGSGATVEDAASCCAAEALERYSLVWQGHESEIIGTAKDVPNAIAPDQILLFSSQQFGGRLGGPPTGFHWVPARFGTEQVCAWTEVTEMLSGDKHHVPAALCYLWRETHENTFAIADTNGCAAAASDGEAQRRALLELIERDAVAMWWYNRLTKAGVNAESLESDDLVRATRKLRDDGRSASLLDITSDLGVPTFAAVVAQEDGSEPWFGAAADPDPAVAASRAFAEAIQFAFWSRVSGGAEAECIRSANVVHSPWLTATETGRPPARLSGCATAQDLAALLAKHGLRTFALRMTRPEIGLPVWRMIVPGLRHAWRRLAPGRLYDVPVLMGWLPRPAREEDLNPWSCPL